MGYAWAFLAIALPCAIWGILDAWFNHREKMTALSGENRIAELKADKAELLETVEQMQDRLAVLERIATDPARRTAQEIEDLRTERTAK